MSEALKDSYFQKKLLWLNGSIPALMLLFDFINGSLGVNPPEAIIRTTGIVSILFLVLTLAVTPISQIAKQTWLIKHRRWLGLFSFYYGCIHLLSYSVFDKGFIFSEIINDIKKRPFILLGFLGLVLMIPLAVTSSNSAIKWLGGKKWKTLHKITYALPVLVVVHYWLIVKSDVFFPAVFASSFFVLLAYRLKPHA